jgi:hypothetical protein
MTNIDITQLATVVGGIIEGGCVVPDPWLTDFLERLRKGPPPSLPGLEPGTKQPMPKGNPVDLSSIGTTRPK